MVLPEPRRSSGRPPTAGAWPSEGAAACWWLGLLRGLLLDWWWSDLWAGTRLTLSPRRGPWLGWPRRGLWLGWRRSDHHGGRSWLELGPLRGPGTAAGAERAKRSWRLRPAGLCTLLKGCWKELETAGKPCPPARLLLALQRLPKRADSHGAGECGADLTQSPRSPGLLASAADPVLLLLLVEAAALADAVLAVHDLALGVEEGEGWATVDAEVLRELLILGEPGALLGHFLTHLTGHHRWGEGGDTKQPIREGAFASSPHWTLLCGTNIQNSGEGVCVCV